MATQWQSLLRVGDQRRLKTSFAIYERCEERMIREISYEGAYA